MKFKLLAMTTLFGVLSAACGNGTTDTGSGGGGTGGGGTGGSGNVTVGPTTNGTGGGTTVPACYDESTALQAPDEMTVTGQNLCTATQLSDQYTACLDMTATQATCDAWTGDAANTPCGDCIYGTDTAAQMYSGKSPVLELGNMYVIANSYACEAAAQGLPQCGPPLAQVIFCAYTACEACGDTEANDCYDFALGADSICANITIPDECAPVAQSTTASPECDGADFQELYTNIGTYFCGAP